MQNRELTTEKIIQEISRDVPDNLRFHFAQCLRIHYSHLEDTEFKDQVAKLYPHHVT